MVGGGVQDGVASAASAMPQGLGQVRLAGARGAAQEYDLLSLDELAGAELQELVFRELEIERCV